jgi:SSS family solute:Na+ symporter
LTPIDYSIIAIFVLAMAAAGLTISKLIRDADDFFVAGRELTPFVLCATITATNLSILHFVSFSGTAYQNGVSIIWQNWTGCMTIVLSGMFVLPIMRRLRIRSIPEFLQLRYSKPLRILAAGFWAIRLCMYLGVILYVAATAAIIITGFDHFVGWLFIFSVLSILYSVIGGAWAIAIMDSVQFCIMLAGAMIILPAAAWAVGGFPNLIHWLHSNPQTMDRTTFVPANGEYNWVFILAITLLSCKWATIDQAILQRAFGARNPRAGARGMVLAGLITAPLGLFYILPGLAITKLHPGLTNPDSAMPWFLANELPAIGRGLLGFVLCGLLAAQVSTITSDINSVATLFTSDVYRNLRRTEPTQKQLLLIVRLSSLVCGAIMLVAAIITRQAGVGAVRANLFVVGILDMPLFVITIVYGLCWKRTNWQGATAGFVAGGLAGLLCYFLIKPANFESTIHPAMLAISKSLGDQVAQLHAYLKHLERWVPSLAPLASTTIALVVTPIVSLLFKANVLDSHAQIWKAADVEGDVGPDANPIDGERDTFHLVPRSARGRAGMALAILGFLMFLAGVTSGIWAWSAASAVAVIGMISVFVGGLVRVYAE